MKISQAAAFILLFISTSVEAQTNLRVKITPSPTMLIDSPLAPRTKSPTIFHPVGSQFAVKTKPPVVPRTAAPAFGRLSTAVTKSPTPPPLPEPPLPITAAPTTFIHKDTIAMHTKSPTPPPLPPAVSHTTAPTFGLDLTHVTRAPTIAPTKVIATKLTSAPTFTLHSRTHAPTRPIRRVGNVLQQKP